MQTRSRTVVICDLSIRLVSRYEAFWLYAEKRYQGFFDDTRDPMETVELQVVADPLTPTVHPRTASIQITQVNGSLKMRWGNIVAEWDRRRQYGWIRQPESDYLPPRQHADYACDSFLRILTSFRMLERNGLVVHAAGLVREGKGYLFVGKSGSGKSTVARCSSPPCTVLSDDLTLACLSGASGTVVGTPFFGEHGNAGVNTSVPLKAIFFLQQAPQNQLRPLSRQLAVEKLLRSVLFFGQEKTSVQRVLDLATLFCVRIPCYELQFLPDASFWSCIDV